MYYLFTLSIIPRIVKMVPTHSLRSLPHTLMLCKHADMLCLSLQSRRNKKKICRSVSNCSQLFQTRDGCSSEQCLGSYDWHGFNSSQFRLFKNRVTWGEARSTCRAHQGDLVSIYSQQEQDFISETLLNDAPKGMNYLIAKFLKILKSFLCRR